MNLRDLGHVSEYREFVEQLWGRYKGNEDKNFKTGAKANLQQRFWEMYLWVTLLQRGLNPKKVSSEGPEFYITINGKKYWIEAVCPTSGSGEDALTEDSLSGTVKADSEKILLRFTNALCAKQEKLLIDIEKGIVRENDGFILAINSRSLPFSAWAGAEIPYIVKACFPIGNLTIPINSKTLNRGEPFYGYQPSITKSNGANVRTDNLLDDRFERFSAVIHSTVNCTSHKLPLGSDFNLIINPTAKIEVPLESLTWIKKWFWNDDTINVQDAVT